MGNLRGKATSPGKLAIRERRQRVLDMRLLGASLRRIADKLAVSHETVRGDLRCALEELAESEKAKTQELRAVELSRLDVAMNAIANKVLEGDLFAVDRWVRISERRAKLCGLDAPVETRVQVQDGLLGDKSDEELEQIASLAKRHRATGDVAGSHGADGASDGHGE